MATNKYITGLDIGSNTIKAVVAEVKSNGRLMVIQAYKSPSSGIRRGAVDDVAETTRALSQIFADIRRISKEALRNAYINIGGSDIHIQSSKGIVAVSRADYEIFQDDIERVVQASQAINLPHNRLVIHSIMKEFLVDGVGDIRDPLGMIGNRLEVNSLIIDAFAPKVKDLTKCVEIAGASIGGLILGSLASARAVLTKNQRDLGVAVVDIGFGTTSLCVYEESKLLHIAVIPVGSGHITNDLAIGLKTSVEAAETVKLSFGFAVSKNIPPKETIDLKKIDHNARITPTKKFIAEIIESRLAEIFEFVNNELKSIGQAGKLPAGVVLVGGGAKLPGIVDLAKDELRLPAQIGMPDTASVEILSGELTMQLEDPEFACALGLVLWGQEKNTKPSNARGAMRNFWKKIFSSLLP